MLKGLFRKGKEDEKGKLYAPMSGRVVLLESVGDPMFAGKILGDGVAIKPNDGKLYSPADGKIVTVAETKHAIGIETKEGLELLIHVGMDTVALGGEGFLLKVSEGAQVKQGDLLMEADLELLKERGYSCVTPMIITNMDAVKAICPAIGDCIGGESMVLTYE